MRLILYDQKNAMNIDFFLVSQLKTQNIEKNTICYDIEDFTFDQFIATINRNYLFNEPDIIIIRNCNKLETYLKNIELWFNLKRHNEIILLIPNNTRIVKELKAKKIKFEELEINKDSLKNFINTNLSASFKKENSKISLTLLNNCNQNPLILFNEIKKLNTLFAFNSVNSDVFFKHDNNFLYKNSDVKIYQLLYYYINNNYYELIQNYDDLIKNLNWNPIQLIAYLAKQCVGEIYGKKRWYQQKLSTLLDKLYIVEYKIKTNKIEPYLGLKTILLT
jgi:DNA polymerase III delta subunit